MFAKCVLCNPGLLRWREKKGSVVKDGLHTTFVNSACVDMVNIQYLQ